MADVHITPEGLEAVQKELDELISHKRPSIVAKIKAARELGDLSENFEYHAAKNEQGMMEARINELEAIIKNHVIIAARLHRVLDGPGSEPARALDGACRARRRSHTHRARARRGEGARAGDECRRRGVARRRRCLRVGDS